MSTSKIQAFLDGLVMQYTLHTNVVSDSNVQLSLFAESLHACAIKVVLFSDERGPVLSVYPAKDGLDFEMLRKETKRHLTLDAGHKFKQQLQGFSIRNLPPFGRLFQMMMVVDERLQGYNAYLIDIGKGDCFLEVDQKGLDILLKGSNRKQFSLVMPKSSEASGAANVENIDDIGGDAVKEDVKGAVKNEAVDVVESLFIKAQSLPVMPEVGDQLIALKGRDDYDLIDLVHLIESDPTLSAKIIAYASSPFFAYQGKLACVQEAVYHVLGSDLSLNISLALAVGEQFKGPMRGPVGAMATWRHAVYCGVLSQTLASKMTNQPDLKPGTAYLHGLLHNIGFLALGHLFPKKVIELNKVLESKKEIDLESVEGDILGVTHTKAGALLMKAWALPEEYGIVVENHHDSEFSGPHEAYCHIVYIVNILLKSVGIGDASSDLLPMSLMEKYNLSEGELKETLQIVLQWNDNIDHLAQQLAA